MKATIRRFGLAGVILAGMAGGALAASPTTNTTTGNAMPNSSDGKMSSFGSTSASGTPYKTGDGRVGAAAPSAGAKIGGGSDSGGGGASGGGSGGSGGGGGTGR